MHPDYIENEHVEMTSPSRVLQKNIDLLSERERVGLKKYGTTLDRKDLSRGKFLEHALEEALDLGMYLQAALQQEAQKKSDYEDLRERLDALIRKEHMAGWGRRDREYYHGCEDTFDQLRDLLNTFDVDRIKRQLK
jgi:hypothetical protein